MGTRQPPSPLAPPSDPTGLPAQPAAHPGPCLHTAWAPQDHERCLPIWGSTVQLPGVCRRPGTRCGLVRPGQVGEGAEGLPRLTPPLDFQVAALTAGPPSNPPRTSALRCAPGSWQSLLGTLSESPTLCRSDRRPWAPAPRPEPPAFTGWAVAQGKGLRRRDGEALGAPTLMCFLYRCPCDGRGLGSSW